MNRYYVLITFEGSSTWTCPNATRKQCEQRIERYKEQYPNGSAISLDILPYTKDMGKPFYDT